MTSQQENFKINNPSSSKPISSSKETNLKNSSYKKKRINKLNYQQQKFLELKTPSTTSGDRFIPRRHLNDNSEFQYFILENKLKDDLNSRDNNFANSFISNNIDNTNNTFAINSQLNGNTNPQNDMNTFNLDNQKNSRTGNNLNYNTLVLDSLMLKTNDIINFNKFSNKSSTNFSKNQININTANDSRVLCFTSKSRMGTYQVNTSNYINSLKNLGEKNDIYDKNIKNFHERIISKTPERILDAPNLIDDYYLNLLDWSSNNVVAVSLAESIYLWNGNNMQSSLLMTAPDDICSVSWMDTNGIVIALGMKDGTTEIWDSLKMALVRKLNGHAGRISSLAWNNHILSTGSKDSKIINHDLRVNNHILHTLVGHTHEVCKLKWSPNRNYLASGGNDNLLCVWDINQSNSCTNSNYTRNLQSNTNSNMNQRSSIINNNTIPINNIDNNSNIRLRRDNMSTTNFGQNSIQNNNLLGNINQDMNVNPISARNIMTNSIDDDFTNPNSNNPIPSRTNTITNLNIITNQRNNNTGNNIINNNIFTISERISLENSNSDFSFSPVVNGNQVINELNPRIIFDNHEAAVKALDWCPWQKNVLASGAGSKDKTIKFWNIDNGTLINSINTGSQVCNVAFNQNERELISTHGYSKNQISLWKYPSMSKIIELDGHMSRVLYMAMSPDGTTIVTGAGDETLRFWKISENKRIDPLNLKEMNSLYTANILSNFQVR